MASNMAGDMGLLGLVMAHVKHVADPGDEILLVVEKLQGVLEAENKQRFGMDTISMEMKYCIDKINKWAAENADLVNEKTKGADPPPQRRFSRVAKPTFYYERFLCWKTKNATKDIGFVVRSFDTMRRHERIHARINGFFGLDSYTVHVAAINSKGMGISSRCMRTTPGKFRCVVAHVVNVFYDIIYDVFDNDVPAFMSEMRNIPREMLPPHTVARGDKIDQALLQDGIDDATMVVRKITGIDLADPSIGFKEGRFGDIIKWMGSE